jgi:hypothetical protein
MARTAVRRWALLPVGLIAMVAVGDEFPTATYRSGQTRERLWKCPKCQRVERTRLSEPQCYGTPERSHLRRATRPVAGSAGLVPSDGRPLFR